MPNRPNSLEMQIRLIEEAMRNAGVLSSETPEWIKNYNNEKIENIWHWLQFVHLPMRMNGTFNSTRYLAPQISAHLNSDQSFQQILQLIIELDSISSTLEKK